MDAELRRNPDGEFMVLKLQLAQSFEVQGRNPIDHKDLSTSLGRSYVTQSLYLEDPWQTLSHLQAVSLLETPNNHLDKWKILGVQVLRLGEYPVVSCIDEPHLFGRIFNVDPPIAEIDADPAMGSVRHSGNLISARNQSTRVIKNGVCSRTIGWTNQLR